MADQFRLEIVSPERLILSEDVSAVTVPGVDGNFTVMGDHAPVMNVLRPGFVHVEGGSQEWVYVAGGFADVSNGKVAVLAEDARKVTDLSKAEIEEAIAQAQKEAEAADNLDDTGAAQQVIDGLRNLVIEAENLGPDVKLM